MCGFVGGTGTAWNYPTALETIAHRGPDASELHLDRRKKGFGIPRYYFSDLGGGKIIQEHVLQSMFLNSSESP